MKTRTNTVPNMRSKSEGGPDLEVAGNSKPRKAASAHTSAETQVKKKKPRPEPAVAATSKHSGQRKQILVARSTEPEMEVDVTAEEKQHNSDTNRVPRCTICSKNFDRLALYKYHMKTRHSTEQKIERKTSGPKQFACTQCAAKFRNSDRLDAHVAQHHPKSNKPSRHDLSAVQAYFDAIASTESARIMREIETILKHTNRFVSCLNSEASLDNVVNYDERHYTYQTLMEKQLEIYEAATTILSVKRDSLKFAFEDWMQKHAAEPTDGEDYSSVGVGTNPELSSDGTIVSAQKSTVDTVTNGDATKAPVVRKDVECQTNLQGSDLQLSDCLNGDEEFEFLDSKTGVYVTNKPAASDEGDDNDDEMVELIEVDEDEYDEEYEFDDSTMEIASITESKPAKATEIQTYLPAVRPPPPAAVADSASTVNQSPLPSQIRNALLDVEADADGFYKCIKCPFTSSASARLIPHYKQTHLTGNASSHPCKQCDRLFIDADDLAMHMNYVHRRSMIAVDQLPVKCKFQRCSKLFRTTHEMRTHMRSHANDVHVTHMQR